MNKITDFFSEEVRNILTDDSLTAIQEAFDARVDEIRDSALEEQDALYAEKLELLVRTLDHKHTQMFKQVLEQHEADKTAKLAKFAKLSKRREDNDLRKFKKTLVESVGAFIDEFISETISTDDLAQAVNNKSAFSIVQNLRQILSVDSAMMNESICGAITEGKERIDSLQGENEKLKKQLNLLAEQNETFEKEVLLEKELSGFKASKKDFMKKAFKGKGLTYIKENLDTVSRLFDRQEKKQLQTLKESALGEREHKPDFVPTQKVVEENVNNDEAYDPYVSELSKVRNFSR